MTEFNYVKHMQAILAGKKNNQDLTTQECKDLFANLMSIAYKTKNQELNTQMCANAAVLIAAKCESHNYQVHVDTKSSDKYDYNVKLNALPDDKKWEESK